MEDIAEFAPFSCILMINEGKNPDQLTQAGLLPRQIEMGTNIPMYLVQKRLSRPDFYSVLHRFELSLGLF